MGRKPKEVWERMTLGSRKEFLKMLASLERILSTTWKGGKGGQQKGAQEHCAQGQEVGEQECARKGKARIRQRGSQGVDSPGTRW